MLVILWNRAPNIFPSVKSLLITFQEALAPTVFLYILVVPVNNVLALKGLLISGASQATGSNLSMPFIAVLNDNPLLVVTRIFPFWVRV